MTLNKNVNYINYVWVGVAVVEGMINIELITVKYNPYHILIKSLSPWNNLSLMKDLLVKSHLRLERGVIKLGLNFCVRFYKYYP